MRSSGSGNALVRCRFGECPLVYLTTKTLTAELLHKEITNCHTADHRPRCGRNDRTEPL
jgi:hypothetical protein